MLGCWTRCTGPSAEFVVQASAAIELYVSSPVVLTSYFDAQILPTEIPVPLQCPVTAGEAPHVTPPAVTPSKTAAPT